MTSFKIKKSITTLLISTALTTVVMSGDAAMASAHPRAGDEAQAFIYSLTRTPENTFDTKELRSILKKAEEFKRKHEDGASILMLGKAIEGFNDNPESPYGRTPIDLKIKILEARIASYTAKGQGDSSGALANREALADLQTKLRVSKEGRGAAMDPSYGYDAPPAPLRGSYSTAPAPARGYDAPPAPARSGYGAASSGYGAPTTSQMASYTATRPVAAAPAPEIRDFSSKDEFYAWVDALPYTLQHGKQRVIEPQYLGAMFEMAGRPRNKAIEKEILKEIEDTSNLTDDYLPVLYMVAERYEKLGILVSAIRVWKTINGIEFSAAGRRGDTSYTQQTASENPINIKIKELEAEKRRRDDANRDRPRR